MHITQGTFSHLPDLTDEEIRLQIEYCINNGWALALEHTDDPHHRNVYWDLWDLPMFEIGDASAVLAEVNACRETHPNRYIKLKGYDASYGRQTTGLEFIVNRPPEEPGFQLERQEANDRVIRYTLRPYSHNEPKGVRYGQSGAGGGPGEKEGRL